uniref:uncharacterized protein LOC120956579 n=1 Tax=Anopheles coluzzii TaxID=1518534 RepID=UPI0020FFF05A|nr:uncharacterized protein LOC120956579 [Anopheles coluzzii]
MQEQWEWMKEFAMPVELLQSIIYLQRALRDCVIQHQFLASKINILAMHQRPIIKRHMLELEREILSIGREQEGVVRQLSERVKRFQMTVQSQRKVALSEDIVCGYVSRHLAAFNDVTDLNGTVPKHISPRLSAAELAQKYSLETLLAANEDLAVVVTHEKIDLEDVERRDSNHTDNAQWDTVLCIAEGKRKNKHTVARNCLKPLVTAQPVGRAQAPSTDSSITIEERPFAGIADQKPPPIAAVKAEKQEDVDQEEEEESEVDVDEEDGQDSLLTPEKTSEDEAEADGKSVQSMDQSVGNRASWMPGLRGRPPKGSKYVCIAKQAAIEARRMANAEQQQQQRQQMQQPPPPAQPNIIQRRVSKRKDVLSEKVEEPIELDVSGNEEEEEEEPTELMNTAAVRRGRSNLLQALNKQKRGSGRPNMEVSVISNQQKSSKRGAGPIPGGSKLVKHLSEGSSGSSSNSRCSTPTWPGRHTSEESSDRRSSPSAEFPALPDPGEPVEPRPTSISEMEQRTFLRYFQIFLPEEVKAMKERKSERKRRSCYSTERKDFHYGKLDYYEQQQQYQAARASKRTHQRPILYSPPVAVAKRRRPPPPPAPLRPQPLAAAAAAAGGSGSTTARTSAGRPRPQPATVTNIFAAMDKRTCFVCSKSGTTEELSACMNCYNIYHLNCHKIDEQSEAYRQRDDLCPVCLISDEQDK